MVFFRNVYYMYTENSWKNWATQQSSFFQEKHPRFLQYNLHVEFLKAYLIKI